MILFTTCIHAQEVSRRLRCSAFEVFRTFLSSPAFLISHTDPPQDITSPVARPSLGQTYNLLKPDTTPDSICEACRAIQEFYWY
jgi:hypothetical protein